MSVTRMIASVEGLLGEEELNVPKLKQKKLALEAIMLKYFKRRDIGGD